MTDDKMIPEERAMELLKMRRSHLRALVKNLEGEHKRVGNKWYYSFREITQLSQIRHRALLTDVSLPERVELLALEVQNLHRLLRNLTQFVGFAHAFWEPTDAELYAVYEKANEVVGKYGSHKAPSPGKVNEFLALATRLTEHEFYRMHQRYRNDLHPWRPFWHICLQMHHALGISHLRDVPLDSAVLQHRISLCMDALRRSILVYCGLIRPDQDFHATMNSALRYPDRCVRDMELAEMQREDPAVVDGPNALRSFVESDD